MENRPEVTEGEAGSLVISSDKGSGKKQSVHENGNAIGCKTRVLLAVNRKNPTLRLGVNVPILSLAKEKAEALQRLPLALLLVISSWASGIYSLHLW